MKIERYAAIDIGSNAVRVLISSVVLIKIIKNSWRVPCAGAHSFKEDSFTVGEISKRNEKRMIKAMKAFKHVMWINKSNLYGQCHLGFAWRQRGRGSRQHQGQNGDWYSCYDRKREAEIIATTNIFESINKNRTFLFIDVEAEVRVFRFSERGAGGLKILQSGTVRMINNMVSDGWDEIHLDRRTRSSILIGFVRFRREHQ